MDHINNQQIMKDLSGKRAPKPTANVIPATPTNTTM